MADRPILCTASVVRNIINGLQTQDRRPLSHPLAKCQIGDRLWVRESFAITFCPAMREEQTVVYRDADDRTDYGGPWVPSIHMPRGASRLTLEVTDVRRQRIWDISEADAMAEGSVKIRDACYVIRGYGYDNVGLCHTSPITPFAILWDELYGRRVGLSWGDNPEVVALTFTTHRCNIDQMPPALAAE